MKSVLLALCFLSVAFAALPAYTSTTCTVVLNDYTNPKADGNDTSPHCTADAVPIITDTKRDVLYEVFSCNTNGDDESAFGRITVRHAAGGAVEISVCNTKDCGFKSTQDTVIAWLRANGPQGNTVPCWYRNANYNVTYVDSTGICNFQGTYSATTGCSCTNDWTGDDCSNPPSQPSRDDSSSAASLFISCFFAVAALAALMA